jgi:serine/threonine-protein kinase
VTTDPPAPPSTSYLPVQVDPLLGQMLAGRYLIQKKLGEGGMGTVYLATHNLLDKQVALKVLHGEFARKPDLVERFMQEAKAASRIRHENVIDVSDFGTTPEGLVFFAMELLTGRDLHDEIGHARLAGKLLPWNRSKPIFLQICAALSAAHALGIIHRDLKPENIYLVELLGNPDFVKLLDFGIAKQTELTEGDRKLTRTGMLFGTPEYMSPEQARGEAVDPRIDVYAMGCILYQLVSGRVPFEADNFMGVLTMHLTKPPPAIAPEVFDSIGAPHALADVIVKAMAKDRDQRFSTMDELAQAVRRASGDLPAGPAVALASVPAPPAAAASRARTLWTGKLSVPDADAGAARRRSRLPVLLGAVVLIGGAAAAFLGTRGGDGVPGGSVIAASAPGGGVAPAPSQAAPLAPDPPAPRVPPPAPAPPPVEPLSFEWAEIRLDSKPPGADVQDLTNGTLIGHTPFTFKVRPSRNPRQFALHRKDYVDTVVELVPDSPQIDYTEKLVRTPSGSAAGRPPADPRVPPPTPGSAAPRPDATVHTAEPAVPAGSAAGKPSAADDDCEPPCLKADPSRQGGADGSAH